MKRVIILLSLLFPVLAAAENTYVTESDSLTSIVEKVVKQRIKSKINVDFCTTLNGTFTENSFDGVSMKMNRLRIDMRGRVSDNFSYRVRQSFNKSYTKASLDNVPAALEYANIQWHAHEKVKLTIGKQFILIGGYEALANSMYVREFADFNDNLNFYKLGFTADFKVAEDQLFSVQIVNNRNGKDSDIYTYGLPSGLESYKLPFMASVGWNGYFADKAWNLIYAASAAPVAKGKNLYYLTCGNIYDKGPIFAYLDVMYSREDIDTQQRITGLQNMDAPHVTAQDVEYLSFIGRFDYRFRPGLNVYVKGAYETSNVCSDNGPFARGHYMTNWNAQACVEWNPLKNDKNFMVFAHYVYKGYNLADNALSLMASKPYTQRISLGVIYVIPVL